MNTLGRIRDPLNDDDKKEAPNVESNANATKFLMTGLSTGWPGGGRGGSPLEGTASPWEWAGFDWKSHSGFGGRRG